MRCFHELFAKESVRVNFCNFHSALCYCCTVCNSTIKHDHSKKFPWNQLFSNFFSKSVNLTGKKCWFSVKLVIVFLTTFPQLYVRLRLFRESNGFDKLISHSTVWKSRQKHDHHFYGKIAIFSVKSTVLLKKLLKSWFHGNFWAWSRFIVLFHTVCVRPKFRNFHIVEFWFYAKLFFCKRFDFTKNFKLE